MRAADVWYEAYRRRVTNFDNWLGGKNQKPTFFGALWTFCWACATTSCAAGASASSTKQLGKTVHGKGARKVRQ